MWARFRQCMWSEARRWVCAAIAIALACSGCIPDQENTTPPDDTRALLSTLELTTNLPPPASPPALSPKFDPKQTTYTVTLPNSATAVTVKASVADPQRATLKINNQSVPSGQGMVIDNIKIGPASPIVILVEESGGGGTTRTYTLTMTRAESPIADLAKLEVSAGGLKPSFDPQTLAYTVETGNTTTTATVRATPAEPSAVVTINGQTVPAGQEFGPTNLALGPNPFTIRVTPPGGTAKQYQVVIIRGASGVADLAALQVSAGALSPAFGPDTLSYSVATENATTQTTVTALPADATARVTVNGQAVTNGQPSGAISLPIGVTTVTVAVTAQDGTSSRSYTIRITRPQSSNNNLAGLSVSAGAISPAFSSGNLSYSLTVPSTVASTTVTPTVEDSTASVAVNGVPTPSGQPSAAIPLAVGANSITVAVTAQNGTAKNYGVTITRTANANLSGLTVSAGALSPGFSGDVTSYNVAAPNANATTTVVATATDSTSTITINGAAVASGQTFGPVPLVVGPTTFTVVVTAAGGAATKTYTVTVTRAASSNANLAGLQVSPGIMTPAFAPGVLAYAVGTVGLFTPQVNVAATLQDPTATLTINGQAVASGGTLPVLVNIGATPIPVVVRAQDTVTVQTYTITVTRP